MTKQRKISKPKSSFLSRKPAGSANRPGKKRLNPYRAKKTKAGFRAARKNIMTASATNAALASALGQTLSLPMEHRPMRLPEPGSVRYTAALSLNATEQAIAVDGMPDLDPFTKQRWLLIQSPSVPLWRDTKGVFPNLWTARLAFRQNGFTGAATLQGVTPFAMPNTFDEVFDWSPSTPLSEAKPSTTVLGRAVGCDWQYVPYGSQFWVGLNLSALATTFAGTLDVHLDLFDGGDITTNTYPIGTSGSPQITGWFGSVYTPQLGSPVWVRVTQITNRDSSYNVSGAGTLLSNVYSFVLPEGATTLTTAASTLMRGLFPLPSATLIDGSATTAPYQSSRLTAASLLLTNVTAELNKEGSILAARLNPAQFNVFNFDTANLSGVHSVEKANLALKTGIYSYVAPQVLPLRDHCVKRRSTNGGSSGMIPIVYLEDLPYANCIILSDQNAATPSQMNVTFCMHLEFMTSLQIFPIGYSKLSVDAYHEALVALAGTGFFFENPTHWANVVSAIKRALSASWPFLKPALISGAKAAGTALLSSL